MLTFLDFPLTINISSFLFLFFFKFGCVGSSLRHVGSKFPDQGSDLGPLSWEHGVFIAGSLGKALILSFWTGVAILLSLHSWFRCYIVKTLANVHSLLSKTAFKCFGHCIFTLFANPQCLYWTMSWYCSSISHCPPEWLNYMALYAY